MFILLLGILLFISYNWFKHIHWILSVSLDMALKICQNLLKLEKRNIC